MPSKKKREITPHKGGRTDRISHRVTPEIKRTFLKLAGDNKLKPADFLEFLIKNYDNNS